MHSVAFILWKSYFKSTLNEAEYKVFVKKAWWSHLQNNMARVHLSLKFQEGHFKWFCVCMFQRQSIGIDSGIHCKMFFSYQS
jgi:hypothetical protein